MNRQNICYVGCNRKSIVVSIAGPSNVGKSTILNNFVGEKISIVSHKVQTTRASIKGIIRYNSTEVVFVDTPGFFTPRNKIEKVITRNAIDGLESDIVMLVIDPIKGVTESVKRLISNLQKYKREAIVVINKMDLLKNNVMDIVSNVVEHLKSLYEFKDYFYISAIKNRGFENLKLFFENNALESEWLFPVDCITDASKEYRAREITRQYMFKYLHKELPYSLVLATEKVEVKNNRINIFQVVYVTKYSHKKIIIGKNSVTIKRIRECAELEMKKIFQKFVHLVLYVKVKEGWVSDAEIVNNIYDDNHSVLDSSQSII